MSYQVIARKWRPQAFEEVTGQDHITRTLRNGIEHGRLHHAYVFSGARGVGKTTTARLFAKALNCHKTDKPNPNPCKSGDPDICPSCLEITESRSMDVLEFDAASNTGVQDIRDIILENINIGAARDRNKVFIIDEVHMLSNSSFNALLKTVEEPPPNVVFIMATTELQKVPDTITSRSQEFIFRTIPQSQIFDRLRLIADAEKIDIDEAALKIISRSGEGSMRDAQSNFDQVISFSGEKITADDVSNALGLAGSEVIEKIVTSIASGESKAALEVVADLVDSGQDLRSFCRDVLAVLRDLLMFKVSGGDASLVESSVLKPETLAQQAERFTEADLVRSFHALAETETKLKDAIQSRYVLEVGLVKLIELRRVAPVEDLLRRLAQLESRLASGDLAQAASAAAAEKKTLKSDEWNADALVRSKGNADALVRSKGNADALVRSSEVNNKKGWHNRGYLPHFDGNKIQFVTFRLADSLPQEVLNRFRKELERDKLLDDSEEYRQKVEDYLDSGVGECILRRPDIAEVVQQTILREDGESCRLYEWVIMPNHAHIVLQPFEGNSLSEIMQRVKSVSSHRINKLLNKTGSLWQPDYFDRYIRDSEHFAKTVRYIRDNPVKAGLCTLPEDWRFSSAWADKDPVTGSAVVANESQNTNFVTADEGVRVPWPVKLPPISSDDLAHFDDKFLDALYERALAWNGEQTGPIPNAESLIRQLLGDRPEVATVASSNGTAAAPARAPLNIQMPDFAEIRESSEIPVLSDNPSEADLLAFANAHPAVQRVRRIFRAKVTGAARITEHSN